MRIKTVWTQLSQKHSSITPSILATALSQGQSWEHLQQQWEQVLALTIAPASPSAITHDEYQAFITRYGPGEQMFTKTTAVCKPASGSSPVSLVSWFHPTSTPSSHGVTYGPNGTFILYPEKYVIENDENDGYHVTEASMSGYYFPHLADLMSHHITSPIETHVATWTSLLKNKTNKSEHKDDKDDDDEHSSRIRFNHDLESLNVRFRDGSVTSIASVDEPTPSFHDTSSGPTFHRGTLGGKKDKKSQNIAFHRGVYGAQTMRFRMDDQGRLIDEHGNIHSHPDPDTDPELEGISIHDATDPESVMEQLIEVTQELTRVQNHVAQLQAKVEQLTTIIQKQQTIAKDTK